MINLEAIETIAEQPEFMEVTTVSGARLEVVPQTLMAALNEDKVAYFRFERAEPAGEAAPVVEGEVIPAE